MVKRATEASKHSHVDTETEEILLQLGNSTKREEFGKKAKLQADAMRDATALAQGSFPPNFMGFGFPLQLAQASGNSQMHPGTGFTPPVTWMLQPVMAPYNGMLPNNLGLGVFNMPMAQGKSQGSQDTGTSSNTGSQCCVPGCLLVAAAHGLCSNHSGSVNPMFQQPVKSAVATSNTTPIKAENQQQPTAKPVGPITNNPSSAQVPQRRKCLVPACIRYTVSKSQTCHIHRGKRLCATNGCSKIAQSSTKNCKAHGGGRRCQVLGCVRSAERSGRQLNTPNRCVRHGGGKRCTFEGCSKSAQGGNGKNLRCKAHGGGRRCIFPGGCPKSAQGTSGLCKAHGGGNRCQMPGCTKSARGKTTFCIKHGGGNRCVVSGCTNSAVNPTNVCIRHGGGRPCLIANCQTSARSGSAFCAKHRSKLQYFFGDDSKIDHAANEKAFNACGEPAKEELLKKIMAM